MSAPISPAARARRGAPPRPSAPSRLRYTLTQLGVLALVIVYAGLAIALGDVRLFVLFGACCCLLSGYWGIYIFPRAKKLLPPFNEQP